MKDEIDITMDPSPSWSKSFTGSLVWTGEARGTSKSPYILTLPLSATSPFPRPLHPEAPARMSSSERCLGHEGRTPADGVRALVRKGQKASLCLFQRERRPEVSCLHPGRCCSPEPGPRGTIITDSQPLELQADERELVTSHRPMVSVPQPQQT